MNWKSWPYSVKGGVMCIVIALIILPFEAVAPIRVAIQSFSAYTVIPFVYLFFGPALFLSIIIFGFNSSQSTAVQYLVGGIISLVWIFLIGAIFGYLYGKFKNRKNVI